jgi:HSP20 family molecular chaperone IbpA
MSELIPQPPLNPNLPVEANPQIQDRYVFTPPIDIFEDADGLVLHADLPGVSDESLDLQIQDNKLTLFGRVAHPHPEKAKLIHQEYKVGDYLRSFILSEQVDYENISAKFVNGVLEIRLPKAPQSQPRKIQIKTDKKDS